LASFLNVNISSNEQKFNYVIYSKKGMILRQMIKERKEKEELSNLIFIGIFYLQILLFVPNLCVNGIILSLATFTTWAAKFWDLGHQLKPQSSLVLVNSEKLNMRLVLINIYEAYRMSWKKVSKGKKVDFPMWWRRNTILYSSFLFNFVKSQNGTIVSTHSVTRF
jgi:hypothetical protein